MGVFKNTRHKALAGTALASVGAVLFAVGAGEARAPEPDLSCLLPQGALALAAAVAAPAAAEAPAAPQAASPLGAEQRALVEHLSRRYQVASEAMETAVSEAYSAGRAAGLDPLLVLAVISIESRFNPVAESVMGAKGLMQIIPKYHRAKLLEHGGDEAVLDPASNIRVGTRILQEYVDRTGTLQAGLQFYNGASWDEAALYSQKVMAERKRLEAALRRAMRAQAQAAAPDPVKGS